ncbi:MAG: EamA family transporter [Planctomycetota bacterium]
MAYVQFVLVCLCFGSNFILMDRATRYFGAAEIGLGRVTSAAALLALLWLVVDRRQRIDWKHLPVIGTIGLIANAYPYVVQPTLIGSGFGHSFFGMTVAFAPLLTILVSIPMLGIRPTKRQVVGVLGGLGFVFLLMYDGNLRGIHLGLLAMAVTVPLSYAVGNTWVRRSLQEVDPTPLAVCMLLVSCVVLGGLVASPPLQERMSVGPPENREEFATAALALSVLGALGTGACTWAFIRMIQTKGPLFAGMVTYIVPVIAMLWGVLDSETITTRQLIAIAGILAMVTLVQAPAKRPDGAEATEEWAAEAVPADA